jgi:hypothetical protein
LARPSAARVVALALPANDAPARRLLLHLTIGALPDGARLVVSYDNGEVAGSVAPYGHAQAASGGTYDIPISRSAARNGSVTLRIEVNDRRNSTTRAPSTDEVRKLELVSVG